jgi:hypothetical protein
MVWDGLAPGLKAYAAGQRPPHRVQAQSLAFARQGKNAGRGSPSVGTSAGLLAPYVMGSVVETAASSLDGFNTGFMICRVIMRVGGVIGMMLTRPARDDAVGRAKYQRWQLDLAEEAHKFALMGERCWSRISTSLWQARPARGRTLIEDARMSAGRAGQRDNTLVQVSIDRPSAISPPWRFERFSC